MWEWAEDEPAWQDDYLIDRELAARLCSGCPVQDECLELELRTAGLDTVGVWGAMSEDDRRGLYSHWCQRGERAEGGPTP
ncbi:transcription factor WhiB [Actinocrispum wychmicini]|uniref:Transcription factor WhiB n=2 Tax=Actinocrispum wychmicini TaxID=1213861 RepID=A0A4R2JLZ0_9PSEU|nr:transcription factor WhiB [Actinocrispum wychmicini]